MSNRNEKHDIAFMGHLATAVITYQGNTFIERGGQAFFGPIAASCLNKRIAAVTSIGDTEGELLEQLQSAGIDLFIEARETTRLRVVHGNGNVDERQMFLVNPGGCFSIEDIPPIQPCLIHLGGLSPQEFPVELLKTLKARGFQLSIDVQSFVWQADNQTGAIHLSDVPEKKEIFDLVDFIKLDVAEGQALTGTNVMRDQARILEEWGARESVITCSEGAQAHSEDKTVFSRFTNRNTEGRTGRGDTFSGAYLGYRLDHSVENSLEFAAALTSIKMESLGPFTGTVQDVYDRMKSGPKDY
jgi:sugar/nucleoside kinase (ribokinase family)